MLAITGPHAIKYGILVGQTQCSVLLTVLSQTSTAFHVEYYGGIVKAHPKTTLLTYSIWGAAKSQYENGSYGQFAMMLIFAGIWPYQKNVILLAAFLSPKKWLMNPLVDYTVGSALYQCGKWAYIDIWVVASIVAVVQLEFRSMVIQIDVKTSIGNGIYLYAASSMQSQVVAGLHVWILEDEVLKYKRDIANVKLLKTTDTFDIEAVAKDHREHVYDSRLVDMFGIRSKDEQHEQPPQQSEEEEEKEMIELADSEEPPRGSESSSGFSLSSIQSTESAFVKYVARQTMKALNSRAPAKLVEADVPPLQYYHHDWPVQEAVTSVGAYDAQLNPDKMGCTCQVMLYTQQKQADSMISFRTCNEENEDCDLVVDDWSEAQVDPRLQRRSSMVAAVMHPESNSRETWRSSVVSSPQNRLSALSQSQPMSPNRPSLSQSVATTIASSHNASYHSVSLIDTALQRVRVSATGHDLPLPDAIDVQRASQNFSVWSHEEPALYFDRARVQFLALISQHKVGCPCYPMQQRNIHAERIEKEENNIDLHWYDVAAGMSMDLKKSYNITIPSSTRNIDNVMEAHVNSTFRDYESKTAQSPAAILRQYDHRELGAAKLDTDWHRTLGVQCVNTSEAVQDVQVNIESRVQQATVLSPRMLIDFSEMIQSHTEPCVEHGVFQYPSSLLQDPLGQDWELEQKDVEEQQEVPLSSAEIGVHVLKKAMRAMWCCLSKPQQSSKMEATEDQVRIAKSVLESAEVSESNRMVHCEVQVGINGQVQQVLQSNSGNNNNSSSVPVQPALPPPSPVTSSATSPNQKKILDELDRDLQDLTIHGVSDSPISKEPVSVHKSENTQLIPIGLNLYNVQITDAVLDRMREHQLEKARNTLLVLKAKALLMSVVSMLSAAFVAFACTQDLFTLNIRFIERTVIHETFSLQSYVTVFMSDAGNRSYFLGVVSVICLVGLPQLAIAMLTLASFLRIILLSGIVNTSAPYFLRCIRYFHLLYRYSVPWMVQDVLALALHVVIKEVPPVVQKYGDNKLFFTLEAHTGLYLLMTSALLLFFLTYPISRWTRLPAMVDTTSFPKLHYKPHGYRAAMHDS